MHLHGSLILQQLLHYNKPIKLVRSCLQLPAARLAQLLADPRGCHVTDSFMSRSGRGNTLITITNNVYLPLCSSTVGEKSREGLVKSLKGEFVGLACSKHGSRTLDTIWKYSSIKSKQVRGK